MYNSEDLQGARQTPLNPGHTHFLLIDDGTENQYGKEIDFWAEFQTYISARMETKIMQKQSEWNLYSFIEFIPVQANVVSQCGATADRTTWGAERFRIRNPLGSSRFPLRQGNYSALLGGQVR